MNYFDGTVTCVRCTRDHDGLPRFGPKKADHPSVGRGCVICTDPFVVGDYTTLVPLGPGRDPEAQERAREGRAYNAVAIEVHWECATGGTGEESA